MLVFGGPRTGEVHSVWNKLKIDAHLHLSRTVEEVAPGSVHISYFSIAARLPGWPGRRPGQLKMCRTEAHM